MSDDDNIFREVDEEIRREQIKAYWDKFGIYIIGVALSIVIVVAGFQGWSYWSQIQAEEAGLKLTEAQRLASENKTDEAAQAFKRLIESGPGGYRILARFQLASSQAADGKTNDAVKTFDDIAKDSKVDKVVRGYAEIQSALLRVDDAKFDEMKKRLEQLNTPDGHWRHSARELLGLSAYKENKFDIAKKHYNEVLADAQAPATLRERANMMLTIIASSETG